jgi:outer membrane protein TolC
MKTAITLILSLMAAIWTAEGQLTLDECRRRAKENYPSIRKYALVERAKAIDVSNVGKAWLPQFQLNARATEQSAVTHIPIDFAQLGLPNLRIPSPAKDQYQVTLEVAQALWDGGAVRAQRAVAVAGAVVDRTQVEVELYGVEEEVDRLFFGILLIDEQRKQNRLLIDELERNLNRIDRLIANGVAQPSDRDLIRVERLQAGQTETQLRSSRRTGVEMIGLMIGERQSEEVVCLRPADEDPGATMGRMSVRRPELLWFEAQHTWLDTRKSLVRSAATPKLGLFLQGGYGRPGLDMLSDRFDLFYIGGVRLSWNFGSLYSQKNDLNRIDIHKHTIDTQRDLFLYKIDLAMSRERREIDRLRGLLVDDDAIIALRENIRRSTEAQVANGAATVSDLMSDLMCENLARTTKAVHEIQLLEAIYKLRNTTNNGL